MCLRRGDPPRDGAGSYDFAPWETEFFALTNAAGWMQPYGKFFLVWPRPHHAHPRGLCYGPVSHAPMQEADLPCSMRAHRDHIVARGVGHVLA